MSVRGGAARQCWKIWKVLLMEGASGELSMRRRLAQRWLLIFVGGIGAHPAVVPINWGLKLQFP